MANKKLNVRLLKEGFTIEQSLKDNYTIVENANGNLPIGTLLKSSWLGHDNCVLYTGMTYSHEVSWKSFLDNNNTNVAPNLYSSGSAALIFISVFNTRIMVVTFGMGHHILKPESYEVDFGIKVVLNSVEHNKIRSLDIRTNDDIIVQKRVQTSKQTEVSTFGIDVEQDILKTISGKPSNSAFATSLHGSDSLSIHCNIEPSQLIGKCEHIFNAYNSVAYQNNFSWYDNIRIIRHNDELIASLNELLYQEIISAVANHNNSYNVYLAYPEIVDYEDIEKIKYTGFGSRSEFDDLDIQNYIDELIEKDIDLSQEIGTTILRHNVSVSNENTVIKHWKLYDCLVYQTTYLAQTYILSSGLWYQVSQSFATEINTFFQQLQIDGLVLPDARRSENEVIYNQRLATVPYSNTYACMDRNLITLPGWGSSIEACDFYTQNKQFIHIKDEAKSSKLSHLFNQGVVSSEAYLREQAFRNQFKTRVTAVNQLIGNSIPRTNAKPNRDEYEVVYAIMKKPDRNNVYDLPFFSKVALRNSTKRLNDLGYKVSLSWIKKVLP